jgi:hypothetical protein
MLKLFEFLRNPASGRTTDYFCPTQEYIPRHLVLLKIVVNAVWPSPCEIPQPQQIQLDDKPQGQSMRMLLDDAHTKLLERILGVRSTPE